MRDHILGVGLLLQRISILYTLLCTSCRRHICPSACLRLSLTGWYCQNEASWDHKILSDTLGILLLDIKDSARNSKGFTPSEFVKRKSGRENIGDFWRIRHRIYMRNDAKYGQGGYWSATNRKSHTRFRLGSKSTNGNDLERPLLTIHAFSDAKPTTKFERC